MPQKRTIESFFTQAAKKARTVVSSETAADEPTATSSHPSYPFPIKNLPISLAEALALLPGKQGRFVNDQPDLDMVYYKPYIPRDLAKEYFSFLRAELPFYRVKYVIRRFGVETQVRTPRWTTVFGIDETSRFYAPRNDDPFAPNTNTNGLILDASTNLPVTHQAYTARKPRPIPQCLDVLRQSVEEATGHTFNFCLVNYYATGSDSISFHSDDERFLGPEPAIASFSLGSRRDFLMKHKPVAVEDEEEKTKEDDKETGAMPAPESHKEAKTAEDKRWPPKSKLPSSQTLKFPLASGDMVLMRGRTQSRWLHSIPKRSGGKNQLADGGRINITFRKALVKAGTDNYYTYNVGSGPVYRWDEVAGDFCAQQGDLKRVV